MKKILSPTRTSPPTTASIGEDFGLWCATCQKCPFPWWLCKCFQPSKWQFYSLDSKLAQDSLRKSLSFKKKCLFSRAAKIPGIFWDYRVRTTLRTNKEPTKNFSFQGKSLLWAAQFALQSLGPSRRYRKNETDQACVHECLSNESPIRPVPMCKWQAGSHWKNNTLQRQFMPRDLGFHQRNENSAYEVLWKMELV